MLSAPISTRTARICLRSRHCSGINPSHPLRFTSTLPPMAPALPSALWTDWQVNIMSEFKIQQIFRHGWNTHFEQAHPDLDKVKAAHAILNCKSGRLGCNLSICSNCGHTQVHNNSCRNRNCPGCQAVLKEVWVDKRRAEVIDAPYYHVVFTLPHELNGLLYCNQKLLYSLFHRCSSETLLELSRDKKYLGATPGIIQVLHTWGQELDYHVHLHCIISGGGLSADGKLRRSQRQFFLPVRVMRDLFKGKFLAALQRYYTSGQLSFSSSCEEMRNSYEWQHSGNCFTRRTGGPISKRPSTVFWQCDRIPWALYSQNRDHECKDPVCFRDPCHICRTELPHWRDA